MSSVTDFDKFFELIDKDLSLCPTPDPEKSYYSCITCGDSAIDAIECEIVCKMCGTLIDIPLDMGAEYRFFSADAATTMDPSRCSFPVDPLLPESSLSTMIRGSGRVSVIGRRVRKYHMWNIMPYRERNLWQVFESLQIRASNAGIGSAIIDEAKELYAQLAATIVCRGQVQRDSILAACLWEALKRHDCTRMPRDIAEIFNIPVQAVTRGIRIFQQTLALRTAAGSTDTYTTNRSTREKIATTTAAAAVAIATPESSETVLTRARQRQSDIKATASRTTSYEDFIGPFLTNFPVPREYAGVLETLVRKICAKISTLGIVPENTPPSLTGSVIAFSCNHLGIRYDLNELARVCGISSVTITKCLKRLQPWKDKLLE